MVTTDQGGSCWAGHSVDSLLEKQHRTGWFLITREGLLDRSWIAGVTSLEVMLAHVVAQFAVMVVQVALVLIFMILVFQVESAPTLL